MLFDLILCKKTEQNLFKYGVIVTNGGYLGQNSDKFQPAIDEIRLIGRAHKVEFWFLKWISLGQLTVLL